MVPPYTLGFLEPGHFHAALTLKAANPRVAEEVHLYATPGPERDAFVSLVNDFNTRAERPTAWRLEIHEGDDPQAALISDGRVDVVIVAGRNASKLSQIDALHAAGLPVLADKPWLTRPAAVEHLHRVTAQAPLAVDIMTSRHDELARLRALLRAEEDVFGQFADGPEPAIDVGSVHHLAKRVNAVPLRRPPWYFDVDVQGDGLVDIQSHMVDQAQWLVGEERPFDLAVDVTDLQARRWGTPVPLALYEDCTGEAAFPQTLAERVRDGVLDLQCNGEIRYRLRGVSVRQRAEWGQHEAEGGGDIHAAVLRGTRAEIRLMHGPHTGFLGEIEIVARPGVELEAPLAAAVARWQDEFPGLGAALSEAGFQLRLPPALRSTHESHFAKVLNQFLDALAAGEWSALQAARIRMRYGLLAAALEQVNA